MLCIKPSGKILNKNVNILKLNFQIFIFFKNMIFLIRFLLFKKFPRVLRLLFAKYASLCKFCIELPLFVGTLQE